MLDFSSPEISVIIPAMNESKTITRVIQEAKKIHPNSEVIVVVNGSTDSTENFAVKSGARVIHFLAPLGHDVGRGIGAKAAKGNILLFTDIEDSILKLFLILMSEK